MSGNTQEGLTVKDRYQECNGLKCPRLLELCKTGEDGKKYFVEGDIAYTAMVLCNNWSLGLSDGDCQISSVETDP